MNDIYAPVVRRILYPMWVAKNRSRVLAYLEEFERTQYWSADLVRELQWIQLKKVLKHAYTTSAFYQKRFQAIGMTPGDIRYPDDIAKIPLTTKEDIQDAWPQMISRDYRQEELLKDMTGGSTGTPMTFYYDRRRLDSRNAAMIRHDRWSGWDIGDKVAILWGATRDRSFYSGFKDRMRNLVLHRHLLLDASSFDEALMAQFAKRLAEYRPRIILAYAGMLTAFAEYVRSAGVVGVRPQAIIASAEVLSPENRQSIEETFQCPVLNRYGCREFSVIASECIHRRGMHINAENLLVEVLPNSSYGYQGEGEIVISDLKNYAMPLIRYRIKDVGTLLPGPCECGRGLPLMAVSGGRVTDFLTATNGRRVSGIVIATYVITNIPGIKQVQFLQTERRKTSIKLVKGRDWNDNSVQVLRRRVCGYLGKDMQLEVAFQETIPSETSGKYRFSVASVDS